MLDIFAKNVAGKLKFNVKKLELLYSILQVRRPSADAETYMWASKFFKDKVPDIIMDESFNFFIQVPCEDGTPSKTMYTSHYDTVHKVFGSQDLTLCKSGILTAFTIREVPKDGDYIKKSILGADDGAGVWLMLQMIAAKKPGLYVFFADEEIGRVGSEAFKAGQVELLKDIRCCISFDRMGVDEVVYAQSGEIGGSVMATDWLCDKLIYTDSDLGSFTDSYTFFDTIDECFNLSVGYAKQHGPLESLDVRHLMWLEGMILQTNFEEMPIARDHAAMPKYIYGGYGGKWNYNTGQKTVDKINKNLTYVNAGIGKSEYNQLLDFVWDNPQLVAEYLYSVGITEEEIMMSAYAPLIEGEL